MLAHQGWSPAASLPGYISASAIAPEELASLIPSVDPKIFNNPSELLEFVLNSIDKGDHAAIDELQALFTEGFSGNEDIMPSSQVSSNLAAMQLASIYAADLNTSKEAALAQRAGTSPSTTVMVEPIGPEEVLRNTLVTAIPQQLIAQTKQHAARQGLALPSLENPAQAALAQFAEEDDLLGVPLTAITITEAMARPDGQAQLSRFMTRFMQLAQQNPSVWATLEDILESLWPRGVPITLPDNVKLVGIPATALLSLLPRLTMTPGIFEQIVRAIQQRPELEAKGQHQASLVAGLVGAAPPAGMETKVMAGPSGQSYESAGVLTQLLSLPAVNSQLIQLGLGHKPELMAAVGKAWAALQRNRRTNSRWSLEQGIGLNNILPRVDPSLAGLGASTGMTSVPAAVPGPSTTTASPTLALASMSAVPTSAGVTGQLSDGRSYYRGW